MASFSLPFSIFTSYYEIAYISIAHKASFNFYKCYELRLAIWHYILLFLMLGFTFLDSFYCASIRY